MSSNNFFRSDLQSLHHITQGSFQTYPKEVILATLKDFFSKDSFYHYSKDQWGFAITEDHTDLPLGADLPRGPGARPELSNRSPLHTRLFIGENYRQDVIFYPAILVKMGTSKYVPISINRNQDTIQYEQILLEDGYGNSATISRPKYFVTAGVWEGNLQIDVLTRSLRSRDDLVELVMMCFTELYFDSLYDIGITVKPISVGSPTETDDRNDKLFRQSLTLDLRSEWRREIPIGNLIDKIMFSIEFGYLEGKDPYIAPNLTINTEVNLTEMLLNL